jgi:hypothetical protein
MLLRVDWEFTLSMVIETYAALADDREATEFAGARKRYEARRGAALQRVARRLEPWALVAAGSDGVVTVRVPVAEPQGVGLTPDIGPGFEGDLRDVLALQADGVVYSVADRTWTLRLDDARGRDRLFPMDFRFTIGSDGRALEGRFIPEKPAR